MGRHGKDSGSFPPSWTFAGARGGNEFIMLKVFSGDDFRGLTVTVMGLGGFGGGVGAVRFLAEQGARIIVTDLRVADELHPSLELMDSAWPLTLKLGRHDEVDFRKTDLVVVNPAVPKDSPFLAIARESGVPLTSEMNLFWERNPGRVVAISGSNGKSTTTALIHSIFAAARGDISIFRRTDAQARPAK